MQEQRKIPEEINEWENEENNNIIIAENNNRINEEIETIILEKMRAILEDEEPWNSDLKEYGLMLYEKMTTRRNERTNEELINLEEQEEVNEIPLRTLVWMVNNQRILTPHRNQEEIIRTIATVAIIERIRSRINKNEPDPELEEWAQRVGEANQRVNQEQRNTEEPEIE